ncbi:MAG: Glucosamine-6-phosphate deaminase 1 [Firmicutes bacterium]|nr:Glucosamine-6-phosphate deaminase 1 [Bacillota bacterium]
MRITTVSSANEVGVLAAQIVAADIHRKPDCVLGLATGETPQAMYRELVRLHREAGLSFQRVTAFALDEYIGLAPDNPNSYSHYLHTHLFRHVNLPASNICLIDGLARDVALECDRYEQQIAEAGGIDLQVLGIGQNGHIGFNEPAMSFARGVHLVELDAVTRADNARFFAHLTEVPRYAISLGIKNILAAKKILLLASGQSKCAPVYQAIRGAVTPRVPASVLQDHPDVMLILDQDAADLL